MPLDRSAHLPISVIVPAHDEEGTIEDCVRSLVRDARPGEIEVVVVCNGCHDETAERARSLGLEDVTVVELDQASKSAAISAGDRRARHFPRVYLDADVVMDTASVRELVRALDGAVQFTVGRPERDMSGCSWVVRAFYRAWTALPASRGWESGVYAVTRCGAERLVGAEGLMGDDVFAATRFTDEESVVVDSAVTTVRVPRRTGDLLRVRTRVRAGNAQLALAAAPVQAATRRPTARDARAGFHDLARLVRQQPRRLIDVAVYIAVTSVAELRARRLLRRPATDGTWLRDRSSRTAVRGAA
jgi:hypothetical protein